MTILLRIIGYGWGLASRSCCFTSYCFLRVGQCWTMSLEQLGSSAQGWRQSQLQRLSIDAMHAAWKEVSYRSRGNVFNDPIYGAVTLDRFLLACAAAGFVMAIGAAMALLDR